MLCKHEANPQENKNDEARSQQSRFAILLKSHPGTDAPPKICSIPVDHPPPGEHLSGTTSVCQKNFKRPKLLKLLFTVTKSNILILKNKKINK